MLNRIIIVSNRLPVKINKNVNGFEIIPSVGGLATGLQSYHQTGENIWIGWPGLTDESIGPNKESIIYQLQRDKYYPVFLSESELSGYYYGFSNNTLWPLFHYFNQYCDFIQEEWVTYKNVNYKFFTTLKNFIRPDDYIWIQDYQLLLLPELIKKDFPDVKIGFFLHIPFPSFETYRLLPWREEILKGILGSDLIGFHTYDYVRHFISSVHRILGYEHTFNQIHTDTRVMKADAFPMGIDYEKFSCKPSEAKSKNKIINSIKELKKNCKMIVSIDRLDYTKGIVHRLNAFDRFLTEYPQYKHKVILLVIAVPSRTEVKQYKTLKKEVDEATGRINGNHGTIDWVPIHYLNTSFNPDELIEIYKLSEVALVTPLRDGMNLVAKEYLASKNDDKGVLILSEMAGAARELGEAIIINPNDINTLAESIKNSLEIPEEIQIIKNKSMKTRIKEYNIFAWAEDFINNLDTVSKLQKNLSVKFLTEKSAAEIKKSYVASKKRLFLLDYDGTLTHTNDNKNIDPDVINIIKSLKKDPKNNIVIISRREKELLNSWFKSLDIDIIAEQGIWIKFNNKNWELLSDVSNQWKEEILSILKIFVKRTPGSHIEEKSYSLAWHYDSTESEMKKVRARELKDSLIHFTQNLNLEIAEGTNLIEIKNAGINKGTAALKKVNSQDYDFVVAIGDDWSDEYLFDQLPDNSYTINVGNKISTAKYNLKNVEQVRNFLNSFTS